MLTALYRHFDAAGVLLYVGISLRPVERLGTHVHGSGWAQQIVRVTVEWLPTRREALDAETSAIQREKPLHNIVGQPSTARIDLPARKARVPAPPPEPPAVRKLQYVDSPEKVAAHFSISLATVKKAVKNGLPRLKISNRKSCYELGACLDWFNEQNQAREATLHAARVEAQRVLMDVMVKAVNSIGRTAK